MARPSRPAPGDLVAVASVGSLLVLVAVLGRHLWFFSDDWNILVGYHDGHLLEPFNGHLSLVPAGAYRLLFHTAGLGSYWPYRIVGLVGLAALGVAVHLYARPRVGPLPAALATSAVIWGSGGVTNVMFPFLVNFSLPIALLVGAWILLDRDRLSADVAASACLAVALATSGLGVLAMGAIGVELAWTRAPLRRWLVFAPPVLAWGAWYVGHRVASPGSHGVRSVVSYALRMLWGGCTALAAGWKPGGVIVALVVVALVAASALRWRTFGGRAAGALAAPLLFAGLTAFTRLHVVPAIPPDEFRYRWTIAAGLVLAVVSLWPRTAPAPPATTWAVPQQAALAAAAVLVLAGAVVLVRDSQDWTDTVVAAAPGLRAELFAAEATAGVTPAGHVLPLSYVPVTEGAYLDAIADVGSPLVGHDAAEYGGSADHRRSADELLAAAVPRSMPAALAPRCVGRGLRPSIPPGTLVRVDTTDPTVDVRLARFSHDGVPVHTIDRADGRYVPIPGDAQGPSRAPDYRVLTSPAVTLSTCG